MKLIEVKRVKKWKVEKILNKRKVREVVKYMEWWKGFTAEYDFWKNEEDLDNTKEIITEFEEILNAEVRNSKGKIF